VALVDREYASPLQFLLDGLRTSTTPAILVDLPLEHAAALMERLMEGGATDARFPAAAAGAKLLAINCENVRDLTIDQARALCAELTQEGSWLILDDIDILLRRPEEPFELLEAVCADLAAGTLPPVAVICRDVPVYDVIAAAPRLAGLVRLLDRSSGAGKFVDFDTLTLGASDPDDVGWNVVVAVDLDGDAGSDYTVGGAPASDALNAVDGKVQVIADEDGRRPRAVSVAFRSDAFTASERRRAFNAAELVARRYVGRGLSDGESVTAVRALYWYPS
jgi:hypothetical protein